MLSTTKDIQKHYEAGGIGLRCNTSGAQGSFHAAELDDDVGMELSFSAFTGKFL
jgi:hypothetical protein